MKNLSSLILFLLLVLCIEWAGHLFTMPSVGTWYITLQKPSWNPPSWVFAPVWTLLYITIGVSGWLIFTKARATIKKHIAFGIYGLQLFCNLLWSFCFFFLKNPGLALINLLILASLIAMNIMTFKRLYKPAAFLLIPYFIWVLYALTLNVAIWILN